MGYNSNATAVADYSFCHFKDLDNDPIYIEVNGEMKPVGVNLFGPGSAEHAKANAKLSAAQMARLRKGKKEVSAAETLQEGATFLTGVTREFVNFDHNGQDVGADADRQMGVWSDRKIGFYSDQASAHVGDWANFKQGSAPS